MPITQIVDGRLAVLADEAAGGLGVDADGSIAHMVAESEKHIHNGEEWYGKSGVDNFLDRDSLTAFQLVAGNGEAYGTEVQISNGDEICGGDGDQKFDLRRIFVKDVGTANKLYKIQFRTGTGTFGEAALLTEILAMAPSNQIDSGPESMISFRRPCNHKIWARCKSEQNGGTIDLLPGIHPYPG